MKHKFYMPSLLAKTAIERLNHFLGAIGILSRIISRLRAAFPKARIRVRLDGGFSTPAILDYLDRERVEYLIGFAGNSALESQINPIQGMVRRLPAVSGNTETIYTEIRYQTRTWEMPRRLVVKAEVVRFPGQEARDNARYVLTNLTLRPERVYKIYRGCGDMENKIKELHHGLEIGRSGCTGFKPNRFRLLLTSSSYLM